MSLAHLKLNPAIAKETTKGEVLCIVCSITVKPKVWTAHLVGKKHREAAEKLKKHLSKGGAVPIPGGVKRAPDAHPDHPNAKKGRVDDVHVHDGGIPSDFFARDGGAPSSAMAGGEATETPWQKGREEYKEIVRERKGLIEGVPQGFFDDKTKDAKVRETAEKTEALDADYEKFMREIAEQDQEKEAAREKDEDARMRQRELDDIDEQMARLKELNELEKKRDAILEGRSKRAEAAAARRAAVAEESGDDDEEMDFDDWRSMSVIR